MNDQNLYLPEGEKKTFIKMFGKGSALSALVLLLAVSYLLFGGKTALAPSDSVDPADSSDSQNNPISLSISYQLPGDLVVVKEVVMAKAGWVAIHDDIDGKPGRILGAYYLPAGTVYDQVIPLLRAVVDTQSYFAVIHEDDGDKTFDYTKDLPRLDKDGQSEGMQFTVTAVSSRGD